MAPEPEALDHRGDVDDLGDRHGELGRLDLRVVPPRSPDRGSAGRHANTALGRRRRAGLLRVDADPLERADPARVVVPDEQRERRTRLQLTGWVVTCSVMRLAVDALDPTLEGAAMLGA